MLYTNDSSAANLIGKTVRNAAGETLGKVEDLIVDRSGGAISFAVLSLGAFGVRDRQIAVPWEALKHSSGREYVLLDVDKNVLANAPAFDRAHWPDTSDAAWRSRIYSHYGYSDPVVRTVADPVARPVIVERPVERHYVAPRKPISALAIVFLALLLVGALAFTYMVQTRGWDQAKVEMLGSMQGVTYAMKDASSDATLTAKVKTAFSLNRRIPATAINVDSNNGVVTLRGEVSDEATRATAVTVAQDTPGVQEVRDHLFVTRGR
jgi:sporulation protein YlmC with PRC-barrel domain